MFFSCYMLEEDGIICKHADFSQSCRTAADVQSLPTSLTFPQRNSRFLLEDAATFTLLLIYFLLWALDLFLPSLSCCGPAAVWLKRRSSDRAVHAAVNPPPPRPPEGPVPQVELDAVSAPLFCILTEACEGHWWRDDLPSEHCENVWTRWSLKKLSGEICSRSPVFSAPVCSWRWRWRWRWWRTSSHLSRSRSEYQMWEFFGGVQSPVCERLWCVQRGIMGGRRAVNHSEGVGVISLSCCRLVWDGISLPAVFQGDWQQNNVWGP